MNDLVKRKCLTEEEKNHVETVKASKGEVQGSQVLLEYIVRLPNDKMNIFILESLQLHNKTLFDLIMDTAEKVKMGYIPMVSMTTRLFLLCFV